MKRLLVKPVGIVALVALMVGAVNVARPRAQSPATAAGSPSFEVASIKPNNSGDNGRRFGMPADRLEATNVPLRDLIGFAYGEPGPPPRILPDYQMSGGPKWIDTDRFDIVAKAGGDLPPGPASAQHKQLMLRTLLAERFRLLVHRETKDGSIYALVLARADGKFGPQLRRSDVDCAALIAARGRAGGPPPAPPQPGQPPPCGLQMGFGGTLRAGAQTMSTLANAFSVLVGRVVVDRTGLSGAFDVDLQFNPDGTGLPVPPGADRPATDAPSIFTAVQERLGLKLESTKGPVDVLVIDRAEHPTDN